jgi:hypothetical protein
MPCHDEFFEIINKVTVDRLNIERKAELAKYGKSQTVKKTLRLFL